MKFNTMTDEEIAREEAIDEYVLELEKNRKNPKLKSQELLEVFPEITQIAPVKVREIQFEIEKHEQYCRDNPIFGDSLKTIWEQEARDEKMKRLKQMLRRFSVFIPNKESIGFTEAEIESAREFSILDLVDQPRRSGSLYSILCPMHDEKTPSCKIYPKDNSFWCFGCNDGGDVIKFVMATDGVDFVTAVRQLTGVS